MDDDRRKPLLGSQQSTRPDGGPGILLSYSGGEPTKDGSKQSLLEQNDVAKRKVNFEYIRLEAGKQLAIALPMVLTNLFQYSILVVAITFVGHLGELELASASLANSIATVLGFCILLGMASALETLCGQAYGAHQYHMLEIHLQRGLVVLYCTCIPLTIIFLNVENLLLLTGQTAAISAKAGEYIVYLLPALYASAFLQPFVKFLQTQSIVKPMVICSGATLAIHGGLCWLIVYKLGLGFRGAAIATSISYWLNVVFLVAYVKLSNTCEKTWVVGFSKEAFTDLKSFIRLAVASGVMICLEYWSFEVIILVAGLLPHPQLELSALSVCLNTVTLNYMIPFGLSAAASTRVSNELGAREPDAARTAVYVVLGISIAQALVVSNSLLLARNIWGWIFSGDVEVVNYVATIMPFIACLALFDGIQGVFSGVARGAGWQDLGVFINLGTFYGLGVPTGMILAFHFGWAGKGLFTGLVTGLGSQMLGLGIITFRTNWKEQNSQAEVAYARQILASFKDGPHSV